MSHPPPQPPGLDPPLDHAAEAAAVVEAATEHLMAAPRRLAGAPGTSHDLARDQLATAQVHALLALNDSVTRLVDLLQHPVAVQSPTMEQIERMNAAFESGRGERP